MPTTKKAKPAFEYPKKATQGLDNRRLLQKIHNEFNGEELREGSNLKIRKEDRMKILDQKIVLNKEVLEHFLKFIAVVAITGGENSSKGEKSQKSVYQKQGILPIELNLHEGEGDLKKRLELVVNQLNLSNLEKFCLRLYQKRARSAAGPGVVPHLLRNSNACQYGNPAYDLPEDYIFESEVEAGTLLTYFGYQKFRGNGSRNKDQSSYKDEGFASATCGINLSNPLIESYHFTQSAIPCKKRDESENLDIGAIMDVTPQFFELYEYIHNSLYIDERESDSDSFLLIDRIGRRLEMVFGQYIYSALSSLEGEKKAYFRIVGIGDGVWSVNFAEKIREQIGSSLAKILNGLPEESIKKIGAIEFLEFRHNISSEAFKNNLRDANNAGFDVIQTDTSQEKVVGPSSAVDEKYKDCVLFRNLAADSRSIIGNEFWQSPAANATATDDPAFVFSSYAGISLNPIINPDLKVFVVTKDCKMESLSGFKREERPAVKIAFVEEGKDLMPESGGGREVLDLMSVNSENLKLISIMRESGFSDEQISALAYVKDAFVDGGIFSEKATDITRALKRSFGLKDFTNVEGFLNREGVFEDVDFEKVSLGSFYSIATTLSKGFEELENIQQSPGNNPSNPQRGFFTRLFFGRK